jgi:hypothetical protein
MKLIKGFYEMLCNLTGSRKGLFFITATGLKLTGQIDSLTWFFAGIAFVSLVVLEKIFVPK